MVTTDPTLVIRGVQVWRGLLDRAVQETLIKDIRGIVAKAPLVSPTTPYGKQMSVQMTSAGQFGWVSDDAGYRYSAVHPRGTPWPDIPPSILSIWNSVTDAARLPESCLINLYRGPAKMGLHQDRDEADLEAPVVSVSLGDDGLFRIGTLNRAGPTEKIWLSSGDVVVMAGEARLIYHGIDKIRSGSSSLLKDGGRINITLRVVTKAL